VVLTLGVALGVGFVPLLGARQEDLREPVTGGQSRAGTAAPTQTRLRRALVVAELALSVMLVIGAGLLVRSFEHLRHVDPGFRAAGLVRASYRLPGSRYPQNFAVYPRWTEVQAFHRELARRVGELARVEAAAIATNHPLQPGFTNSFVILGREVEAADQAEIHTRVVDARYFETVGVPLRDGRLLESRDDAEAAVVVVINEAARRKYFPDVNAIGQRLRFWGTAREIVGVVGDERFEGLGAETPPAVYAPLAQNPLGLGTLLVRTTLPEAQVEALIRREVRGLDPDLALYDIGTMEQALQASVARERFTTTLLGAFAAAALLLALVGVHGVLSYAVVQRRREMGIRMALGAQRAAIVRLVVAQGLALAAVGVALGVVGALAAARTLGSLLHGVTTTDALTYAAAVLGTLLVACGASWLPARRATGVDPAVVLREE
jgi:predicted permease